VGNATVGVVVELLSDLAGRAVDNQPRAAAFVRNDSVGRVVFDHVIGCNGRGAVYEATLDRAVRIELRDRTEILAVEEALSELSVDLLTYPAVERVGQILDPLPVCEGDSLEEVERVVVVARRLGCGAVGGRS
jgi:hypothetical protein